MTAKKQITAADQALTLAGYAVRKAKTDPVNRNAWLKDAATHIATAGASVKAAAPAPAPAPAKKAPAKKAAPKKAKK